jgi:hypothetical protein
MLCATVVRASSSCIRLIERGGFLALETEELESD